MRLKECVCISDYFTSLSRGCRIGYKYSYYKLNSGGKLIYFVEYNNWFGITKINCDRKKYIPMSEMYFFEKFDNKIEIRNEILEKLGI